MPPKPRMVRHAQSVAAQPSSRDVPDSTTLSQTTAKNKSTLKIPASGQMLPPPQPPPQPKQEPGATLRGEVQALENHLKEAARNTGRVLRFYSDTKNERMKSYAPYPPQSITRSLGRSLEKYDQICDAIETQLQHAISVLERDLESEHARLEAEALASNIHSRRPSLSPSASRIPLTDGSLPPPGLDQIPLTDSPTSTVTSSHFPLPSGASATSTVPRRSSAILSSLHRPGFPLKLDLSAVALSGGNRKRSSSPVDVNVDLGLTSLPSPVTLAPKTARALPNDPSLPDVFGINPSQSMPLDGSTQNNSESLVKPVGGTVSMKTDEQISEEVIDLTGPESAVAPQLGDSAEKPIELDSEESYDDLFRNVHTTQDKAIPGNNTSGNVDNAQLNVNIDELFTPQGGQNTFQLDQSHGTSEAPDSRSILATIAANTNSDENTNTLSSIISSEDAQAVPNQMLEDTFPNLSGESGTDAQFDLSSIDLSSFTGLFGSSGHPERESHVDTHDEMELMSQLLAMDGDNQTNPSVGNGQ